MVYKVLIAQTAIRDAQEYASFIIQSTKSTTPARKWLDELYEEINSRSDNPSRFSVIDEAEELGFPYRSFIYHSHRVIFAVLETEQIVMVHRIYHGARDQLTKLEVH